MYKNLTVFTLDEQADFSNLSKVIHDFKFNHVTSQQMKSVGWESPFDTDLDYRIDYGNVILLVMRKEERIIPAASVVELLKEAVIEEERLTNRKVSKKERAEMKDGIIISLMPRALLKTTRVSGYVDLRTKQIVINTSSIGQAEEFVSLLRHTLGGLPAFPLYVDNVIETEVFTRWLSNVESLPDCFDFGDACKLTGESAKAVTFKNFALWQNATIAEHIRNGMVVSELRLNLSNNTEFTVNDKLQFKALSHVLKEVDVTDANTAEEQFVYDTLIDIEAHRILINTVVQNLVNNSLT